MGFILTLLIIVAIISFLSYACSDPGDEVSNATAAAIICGAIASAILIIAWGVSYSSNITLHERAALVEDYAQTVKLYEERAPLKDDGQIVVTGEITDFKYQSYQEAMSRMLTDLRYHVASYNENLAAKRRMKSGWYFNWIIILDDDLKPIRATDYLK